MAGRESLVKIVGESAGGTAGHVSDVGPVDDPAHTTNAEEELRRPCDALPLLRVNYDFRDVCEKNVLTNG